MNWCCVCTIVTGATHRRVNSKPSKKWSWPLWHTSNMLDLEILMSAEESWANFSLSAWLRGIGQVLRSEWSSYFKSTLTMVSLDCFAVRVQVSFTLYRWMRNERKMQHWATTMVEKYMLICEVINLAFFS